jgi:hypothetical protein
MLVIIITMVHLCALFILMRKALDELEKLQV